jgi:hypothetical protein
MRDRSISLEDLNQLRLWVESKPEVPDGDWYKDFGSFKICGQGPFPKTFLLRGQAAKGFIDLMPRGGADGAAELQSGHHSPILGAFRPPSTTP